MEIIKLRAWDKEHEKMTVCMTLDEIIEKSPDPFYKIFKSDYEWMRFTGLRDSKGVEIYEGDIVKVFVRKNQFVSVVCELDIKNGDIGEVFYCPAEFTVAFHWREETERFEHLSQFLSDQSVSSGSDKTSLKVIGNIYQNQELLNAKA